MNFVFFNELGVEPIAYVGSRTIPFTSTNSIHHVKVTPVELIPRVVVDIKDTIHKVTNTSLVTKLQFDIGSGIHKLYSTPSIFKIIIDIPDSIHRQLIYYKLNANISIKCGRYIQTPYENRYLETPKINC